MENLIGKFYPEASWFKYSSLRFGTEIVTSIGTFEVFEDGRVILEDFQSKPSTTNLNGDSWKLEGFAADYGCNLPKRVILTRESEYMICTLSRAPGFGRNR